MSDTYAGSFISAVADTPTANDKAGFEALSFVDADTCALQDVPPIARSWDKVAEDLVCGSGATFERKGGYMWDAVTFKMSRLPSDSLQAILVGMEADNTVGSFKLTLSKSGTSGIVYFQAQCSKFAIADGGTKNTIHTSSVELILQDDPVFVAPT